MIIAVNSPAITKAPCIQLACDHFYHVGCITIWFKTQAPWFTCCCCRRDVNNVIAQKISDIHDREESERRMEREKIIIDLTGNTDT